MAYVTHGGKEIKIVQVGNHLKIMFATGGEIPKELDGLFTEIKHAEAAINFYLDATKDRKKNAKGNE